MEKINFGGIQAQVFALSPHNSYFLFRLCDRIAIKGIYTADFVWDSVTDNLKGFLRERFTLYVGAHTFDEAEIIKDKIIQAGGTPDEDVRLCKHVQGFLLEVRAIGLSPEYLLQTLEDFPIQPITTT
jgi:hypothetical protein